MIAERQGVPALGVMTTRFASAASLMCRMLGLPDYRFVTIEHPVSSATDARLAELAQATMAEVRELLLART